MRPADVVVEVAGAARGRADEVCGTVVDGGEAAREWIGRRVVVPRLLPCGDCAHCRRGRVALCPSLIRRAQLERRQTVPARWLTSVEPPLWPAKLDPSELWQLAALAEAALAPYTALSRAGVGPSDTVVVVGRDARARFAAALAAVKGARVAPDDSVPVDGCVIIATQPNAPLARGATLVLLDGATTDAARVVEYEATIVGVGGGHPDLLPELCALVVRGQLPLADFVCRASASSDETRLPIVVD